MGFDEKWKILLGFYRVSTFLFSPGFSRQHVIPLIEKDNETNRLRSALKKEKKKKKKKNWPIVGPDSVGGRWRQWALEQPMKSRGRAGPHKKEEEKEKKKAHRWLAAGRRPRSN